MPACAAVSAERKEPMNNAMIRGRSTISGGVFLIGLGMLLLTGWWWPGIMLVVGAAGASELFLRGQVLSAIGTFAFFAGIPLAIALVDTVNIPWGWIGAFVLIVLGLVSVGKSLTGRAE
jgi:hypothetical protein